MNISTTIRAGKATVRVDVRPADVDAAHLVAVDVFDDTEGSAVLQLSGKVTHAVVRRALSVLLARVGGGVR